MSSAMRNTNSALSDLLIEPKAKRVLLRSEDLNSLLFKLSRNTFFSADGEPG